MVIFDQLRLSDNAENLYITAHVNSAVAFNESGTEVEPYKDVYITDVIVTDAQTIKEVISDPETIVNDEKYHLFKKTYPASEKVKAIDFVLDNNNFIRRNTTDVQKMDFCKKEMLTTLFFVFIRTTEAGAAGYCLPCYMQKPITTGVTFDENILFQNVMNYTRELADDCNIPKGFIDFILRWNAFKAAIETEHYKPAIDYYNMLFGEGSNYVSSARTKGCGCHG